MRKSLALVLFALVVATDHSIAQGPPPPPSSSIPGGVTFNPASPTVCDSLVVTYAATGDVITVAHTQVFQFITFNNFATTNFSQMSQVNSNTWIATNTIPDTATNAIVVFVGVVSNTLAVDQNTNNIGFAVAVASCYP